MGAAGKRAGTWSVLVAGVPLLCAACFAPRLDGISCADNGLCPSGQICDPVDDVCRASGLDGSGDDAAVRDGPVVPPDGASLEGCDRADVVLCMRMNGSADDSSASNRAITASALGFTTGVAGQAGDFSADTTVVVDSYIDQSPHPETIELWLRVDAEGRVMQTPLFTLEAKDGQIDLIVSGTTIGIGYPTQLFGHLAIVLSSPTEVYINGSRTGSIGFNLGAVESPELRLGSAGATFGGRIDELRVWSRALGAQEVAAIAGGN